MPKMNDGHHYAFQTTGSSNCLNLSKELPADTLVLSTRTHTEHPEIHMVAMEGQVSTSHDGFLTRSDIVAHSQQDTLVTGRDDISDLIGIRALTAEKIGLGCPSNPG
jgi:hypothetical protein